MIKCPVVGCQKSITVSYKSYPSYFKAGKKQQEKQRPSQPRWYLYNIEKHLKTHVRSENTPAAGDVDTSSNDFEIENHTEGSSTPDDSVAQIDDNNVSSNPIGSGKENENLVVEVNNNSKENRLTAKRKSVDFQSTRSKRVRKPHPLYN